MNHAVPADGRRQSGTAEARRSRFPAGNQPTGDPEYLRGPAGQAAHARYGCRFRTRFRAVPPPESHRRRNGIIGTFLDWASCGTGCGTATASPTRRLTRRRLTRTQAVLFAISVAIFWPSGEPRPVHGSQPCGRLVGAVRAGGDVIKTGFAAGVERGVEETGVAAVLLIDQRDESGPERRDSAGAADHGGLSVDQNLVSGFRCGIAGDIGHAAATAAAAGCRHVCAGLPRRQREVTGHAAAGGSAALRQIVPNRFIGANAVRDFKLRAAAGQHMRAGGGKVDMVCAVGDAVA